MPTNLAIDDRLVEEAKALGNHRTKKDTVNEALREYIAFKKRIQFLELKGMIDYDPSFDYKSARRRKGA